MKLKKIHIQKVKVNNQNIKFKGIIAKFAKSGEHAAAIKLQTLPFDVCYSQFKLNSNKIPTEFCFIIPKV